MRWYISATAVKQYMAIQGYVGSPDGPIFDRAAIELEDLCDAAKLAKDVSPGGKVQQWRVKATVRGKRTRLEFGVSIEQREEGDLPQLIHVRNKGA